MMIRKDGSTTPAVAATAPFVPATFFPMNVAELIAIGPGVDSAMAITSRISSLLIHFF